MTGDSIASCAPLVPAGAFAESEWDDRSKVVRGGASSRNISEIVQGLRCFTNYSFLIQGYGQTGPTDYLSPVIHCKTSEDGTCLPSAACGCAALTGA